MTREIKFRAFDDGKMIYSHNNSFNHSNVQLHWFFQHIREDAIVMQYTGRKGNLEVEIYEGDIVRGIEFGVGANFEKTNEIWSDRVGKIAWDNDVSGWVLLSEDLMEGFVPLNYMDEYDVIGNIHENPDLLK